MIYHAPRPLRSFIPDPVARDQVWRDQEGREEEREMETVLGTSIRIVFPAFIGAIVFATSIVPASLDLQEKPVISNEDGVGFEESKLALSTSR